MASSDYWFLYARRLKSGSDSMHAWIDDAEKIDQHLKNRQFFVGYSWSSADLAMFQFFKSIEIDISEPDLFPNIQRWYASLKDSMSKSLQNGMRNVEGPDISLLFDEKKLWFGLPGLIDGTSRRIVTRFLPDPSGFMHIGHCKAAMINYNYAKRHDGKFIVRVTDTNPSKDKMECATSILEDLSTLGILPTTASYTAGNHGLDNRIPKVSYTSDYFPKLLTLCEEFIKLGFAYCDATPIDEMRNQKLLMQESSYRSATTEENLAAWEEMKKGSVVGSTYIVRAKIDVTLDNGAMRDPAMYRVNHLEHIRTGRRYCVYPLHDFACPMVDIIEGVTHVIRSNEFHDKNEQYMWFVNHLKLLNQQSDHLQASSSTDQTSNDSSIQIIDFPKLNFASGRGDQGMPTIRGLLRRGLSLTALEDFITSQGASKNVNLVDLSKLWSMNRTILDPVCPRWTAIEIYRAATVYLSNYQGKNDLMENPCHKKNLLLGLKTIHTSSSIVIEWSDAKGTFCNEEVTLMDWGNCLFKSMCHSAKGKEFETSIDGELNLEGDFKKTKKKLTWLPSKLDLPTARLFYEKSPAPHGELTLTPRDVNFEDFTEHDSVTFVDCHVDEALVRLKKGDCIQFERKGLFICDKPYSIEDPLIHMIAIPDGSRK